MRKILRLLLAIITTCFLLATTSTQAATGFLKIHMLAAGDGRGDCFIIELPDNTKMVVDNPDGWTTALINRLNALGFGGGIKYLVGTHQHTDHIGGLNNFLNSGFTINNTQIYYPKGAINANAAAYDNLVTSASNRGLTMRKLEAGDYIINTTHDGKPFKVRCLSPEISKINGGSDDWGSMNEASLVLKITYGTKSILMQADGYGSTELSILAGPYASEINNCQVIKVGHHGVSANGAIACREAYLDAAGVTKALITDGDRAINDTIKQRLQARNIRYWSTGVGDGYCWLGTDGAGAWEESENPLWPPTVVVNPPTITTQPQSQTVNPGANATFTVAATGTGPLEYQWRFNGVDITDANSASLTITNAQSADAGSYSVVVENDGGSTPSANATLTVRVPPAITTQPSSFNASAGADVTFTVTASGTAPLSYQWRFNGANIAGATTASLTKSNVQSADAGNYSVVVSNAAGSATSADGVLMVTVTPPSITAQPASQSANVGASVTFTVSASGSAPLGYQWKFNAVDIAGATAASFTKSNVQTSDAGNYSVVVSNGAGSVTSANAALTVNVPPSITTQPTSRTVNAGTSTTFTVAASGTAPLSYQWRFNGANIAGATAASYTKSNVQASDAGNYSAVVSNVAGSATSADAALTVNVAPTITTQPAAQTVVQGSAATFNVVATGSGTLTYQWRFNGANISGATGSSYTRSNVQTTHQGNYSVVVANSVGSVTSANAALTVKVSVTVDNSNTGFTATTAWSTGTSATDKFGTDYRFRNTTAVSDPVTWSANLGNTGSYTVSAWWSQGVNRSTTAPYIVNHSTGSTTVNKNQQANGGTWQSLGIYTLNSGTNTVRLSCWTTTGFVVIADAVKWSQ